MRTGPTDARRAPLASRLTHRLECLARAVRSVLGAPDYDAYLAYLRERRPDASPLSRDQFIEARMRARYERPGSRCC